MSIIYHDGKELSEIEFRMQFPDSVLPEHLTPEFLEDFEASWLDTSAQWPQPSSLQKVVRSIAKVGTIWTVQFTLEDLPTAEKAAAKELAQERVWDSIKAERTRRLNECGIPLTIDKGGVPTLVGYSTDVESRTRYLQMLNKADRLTADGQPDSTVLATPNGTPMVWKLEDNEYEPVTIKIIRDLTDAMENQEQAVFYKAEEHHQLMLQAPDPEAYDFSTGWPPTYAELAD